jgi:hypothetical protein
LLLSARLEATGDGGGEARGGGAGGNGSPTDEVINSALRYRVQAPLIDNLLSDIGIEGGNLSKQGGLIREASDMQRIAEGARKGSKGKGEDK